MSWYSRLLNQTCTYWGPTGHDNFYADETFAAPIVLSGACRWEERTEKFLGKTNRDEFSNALVWLDQDVKEGGYLASGSVTIDDPKDVPHAFPIRRFDKIPGVKNRIVERIAIL